MAYNHLHAQAKAILIVEDDESTGDVLTTAIAQETPYTSRLVSNGAAALVEAPMYRPDLFILDLRLPDMTGIELYDQLQALPGFFNIPVLLMTASKYVTELDTRDIVVLEKPFDLDEFVQTLKKLLG